mmetsp:Transcript_81474/g.165959  ORF Transcript_81474/g.165959 Transcript_81474/m.165959 type:complete len:144 (+) Transcript_81474:2928-3359(+)
MGRPGRMPTTGDLLRLPTASLPRPSTLWATGGFNMGSSASFLCRRLPASLQRLAMEADPEIDLLDAAGIDGRVGSEDEPTAWSRAKVRLSSHLSSMGRHRATERSSLLLDLIDPTVGNPTVGKYGRNSGGPFSRGGRRINGPR